MNEFLKQDTTRKVSVVGLGMVGASFAYSLMQRGLASELVLLDLDHARAEGEAMDLSHGLPFVQNMNIYAGRDADMAGSAVVVLTAGANQKPGETRLDLLAKNAAIFGDIIPRVLEHAPDAVMVVATNPVDLLTQLSAERAGLDLGRVIGSGTILDTARFRTLLGAHYAVDPRSVHAYIVGEHGDSELALWSTADIGGVPLEHFVGPNAQGFDKAALESIFEQVRGAARAIIERKGSTYYGIGLSLLAVVEAVLRDQHTVLTVSSPLSGQCGVSGMSLSLPSVVGRRGIETVLELPMNEVEKAGFLESAAVLKRSYAKL